MGLGSRKGVCRHGLQAVTVLVINNIFTGTVRGTERADFKDSQPAAAL